MAEQAASAVVNSMVDQLIVASIEVGITGNSAAFDIEAMLKSAAIAGATQFIGAHIDAEYEKSTGINLADKSGTVLERIKRNLPNDLLKGTANAAVITAVQGGSLSDNLVSGLRLSAAASIGEEASFGIGAAFRSGEIDKATQLMAHAVLGCAVQSVASSNCVSGAVGAVSGEVAADIYFDEQRQLEFADELKGMLSDGSLTEAEARSRIADWKQQGVDVARLAGGLSALVAGGDVDAGASSASNAAENNACGFGVCVAAVLTAIGAILETADKVLVVKDAVDLVVALNGCQAGNHADCTLAKDLAEDAAIELTLGSVVPGSKVGVEVFDAIRKKVDPKDLKAVEDAIGTPQTQQSTVANSKTSGDNTGVGATSREVSFDPKQVQKKYTKHAEDFGVTGNYNKANAEKFQSAVDAHIKSPDVKPITGTYRGDPVVHYVDPKTGLNVMKDPSGNFISGWKLNPAQLKNVIKRGKL